MNILEHNPSLEGLSLTLNKARLNGQLCLQSGDMGYASAPSNIALLKYWGKKESLKQIPVNSSVSLTLDCFRASTQVEVLGRFFPDVSESSRVKRPEFLLQINGKSSVMPEKMCRFLESLLKGFADDVALRVTSENNFPTACGVASSAAGYAALVGAIADLLNLERFFKPEELNFWLTEWSRLGSGSATRSAVSGSGKQIGQFVAWELQPDGNTTRTYELSVADCAANLMHCVLVLDDREKAVGSSEGHSLAATSLFQELRLAQFPLRFEKMKRALEQGNLSLVGELTECDAYEMHTVMATGRQSLRYMTQQTIESLSRFVRFRNSQSAEMFWTLDAGANPHFIFDASAVRVLAEYFVQLSRIPQFADSVVLLGRNSGRGVEIGRAKSPSQDTKKFLPTGAPLKLGLAEAADYLRSGDRKW
jgi:diphosphomevalonate decarboxylase